jgi:hypothetical protein
MAERECGSSYACVAGRCVNTAASADAAAPLPAIAARGVVRLVARPTDLAYLRHGDPAGAGVPEIVTLGTADGSRLFMRFDAAIPAGATVIEAHLIVLRASEVDADPAPVALHAARVAEPWSAASISWARQPRVEETRSPAAFVTASGREVVRIDVRELVAGWALHDARDQGLALVADTAGVTGVALRAGLASPRLDIYYRLEASAVDAGFAAWPAPSLAASDAGARPLK